jgi:hypothetical protein
MKKFIKELKQSKWYWFIPVIGLGFLWQMSKWMFNGETYIDRGWRLIVIECIIPINVMTLVLLYYYFIRIYFPAQTIL